MKHRLIVVITTILVTILCAIPVFAIDNPDNIDFGTGTSPLYKVFENVLETGDMLFVAEGYVDYTVEPTDYKANEAFLFEIMNTSGNVTLLSRSLNSYGDRPISIYQTATQVTALGLISETSYIMRISGNPLIFASPTGNSANATLAASDYVDQSVGATSDVPTDNNLRNFLILMAENIQANDTPTYDYYESVQGYRYLTNAGSNIFIEGIPNLFNMCPILFQYGASQMDSEAPESTGAYAAVLTPLQKWGQLTADGLTNIGVFLGINQALAGSVVLFLLAIALAVYVYKRTQSGVAVLILVSATPFIGGYLGLMPMAIAFIFVIVVVIFMGYYFFSRGAL
jgi:hypothetical protein